MRCSYLMWQFVQMASTWKSSLRDSIYIQNKTKKNHQGSRKTTATRSSEKKGKKKKKPEKNVNIREERKKKKKNPDRTTTWVARRPGSRCDLGRARPGSSAWICLCRHSFFFFFFFYFFFFSFFLPFSPLFLHFGLHLGSLVLYFWVGNRVSKTQFPCRRHLDKLPHQI